MFDFSEKIFKLIDNIADKLSKDLPPKTESELMAELIKFKQRHVGRIVPTYVSEYNGRYVDFSKS